MAIRLRRFGQTRSDEHQNPFQFVFSEPQPRKDQTDTSIMATEDCQNNFEQTDFFGFEQRKQPNHVVPSLSIQGIVCNKTHVRLLKQVYSMTVSKQKESVTLDTLLVFNPSQKHVLTICCKRREVRNRVSVWAYTKPCETKQSFLNHHLQPLIESLESSSSVVIEKRNKRMREAVIPTVFGCANVCVDTFFYEDRTCQGNVASYQSLVYAFVTNLKAALSVMSKDQTIYPWFAELVNLENPDACPTKRRRLLRKSLEGVIVPPKFVNQSNVMLYEQRQPNGEYGHKMRFLRKMSNITLSDLLREVSNIDFEAVEFDM